MRHFQTTAVFALVYQSSISGGNWHDLSLNMKKGWNIEFCLKMKVPNRNLLFQGVIFRCHVCSREGILTCPSSKEKRDFQADLVYWRVDSLVNHD